MVGGNESDDNLGLEVVAEGVEDRANLEQLASWGCDSAQGYYFSRPLSPTDFATWLAAGRPPRRKAAAGIRLVG